jgi:hypothetical protein
MTVMEENVHRQRIFVALISNYKCGYDDCVLDVYIQRDFNIASAKGL